MALMFRCGPNVGTLALRGQGAHEGANRVVSHSGVAQRDGGPLGSGTGRLSGLRRGGAADGDRRAGLRHGEAVGRRGLRRLPR